MALNTLKRNRLTLLHVKKVKATLCSRLCMLFDLWPVQQVRDLNDRLQKNQRIIDQLHEEIKKLKDGQGGGGCDINVMIQRVCHSWR